MRNAKAERQARERTDYGHLCPAQRRGLAHLVGLKFEQR